MSLVVTQHSRISDFTQEQWNALAVDAGPFLRYEFLSALESSGSVNNDIIDDTGWQPHHLSVCDKQGKIVALVPGYEKTHSYGEYVFDHAWANAYHQHGLRYYPKWIAAIPFTPVTGNRLLSQAANTDMATAAVLDCLDGSDQYASYHWLFNDVAQQQRLVSMGLLPRYSVQFQWHNRGFEHFDEFLTCFKSRKRKDIKKERIKAQTGITIERLTGEDITDTARDVFYLCYQQTYLKRSGHQGYLTKAFFESIFSTMRDNILLVLARNETGYIASSLLFYDHTGLYGRYWGALKDVDGLHFECCYYQGIEFAIEHKLRLFNPGTQGEHKLLRGFEPTVCASAHKLHDHRFHTAVDDFLRRESQAIADYFQQTEYALPFNEQTRQSGGLTVDTHKIVTY